MGGQLLPPPALAWGIPSSLEASGSWFAFLSLAELTGRSLKAGATCQTQNGPSVSNASLQLFFGPWYMPGFVRETQAARTDPSLPQGERAVSTKLEFEGKTATGGGSTATWRVREGFWEEVTSELSPERERG